MDTGYKKKSTCEKCGFKPIYHQQLMVYHIDKNVDNFAWNNLKTICFNCQEELRISGKWIQGDLIPDI